MAVAAVIAILAGLGIYNYLNTPKDEIKDEVVEMKSLEPEKREIIDTSSLETSSLEKSENLENTNIELEKKEDESEEKKDIEEEKL